MMTGIITGGLVERALKLAEPSITTMLNDEGCVWGPRRVAVIISAPGLYMVSLIGEDEPWNPEWGEERDFMAVARAKLDVTERSGLPSGEVVDRYPWLLQKGNYFYPGAVCHHGVVVAVSGAKGETDEGIAEMILALIFMLCKLRACELQEDGVKQL